MTLQLLAIDSPSRIPASKMIALPGVDSRVSLSGSPTFTFTFTFTTDIKLDFAQYDCVPDHTRWLAFEKDCYGHGGVADDHGCCAAEVTFGRSVRVK